MNKTNSQTITLGKHAANNGIRFIITAQSQNVNNITKISQYYTALLQMKAGGAIVSRCYFYCKNGVRIFI